MVPITEEERNGPLYKYFMRDMVEPDPAKYAQTQEPVDFPEEESALHLDNLFDPGYMPVELGYGYILNTDGNNCPYINPVVGVDVTDIVRKKLGLVVQEETTQAAPAQAAPAPAQEENKQ